MSWCRSISQLRREVAERTDAIESTLPKFDVGRILGLAWFQLTVRCQLAMLLVWWHILEAYAEVVILMLL
jgi:hypothetical protein